MKVKLSKLERDFIMMYNDPTVTARRMRAILHISESKYNSIKYKLESLGLIPKRKVVGNHYQKEPKYYTRYIARTIVYFPVRRKGVHYCNCKIEQEAQNAVKFLKENNWDKEKLLRWLDERKQEC